MSTTTETALRINTLTGDEPLAERLIFWGLQPLLVGGMLTAWYFNRDVEAMYILCLAFVQFVLAVLEHRYPARPAWRQAWREKAGLVAIAIVLGAIGNAIGAWYASVLAPPLADARAALGLDIWPHGWPLLAQVFLAFLASELIWYGMHRLEHRFTVVWKLSAHGAHHAFKRLNAINSGANHPLEMFWIVLPGALVELFFGVGMAMAGTLVLVVTQASIAHTNLRLNTRGIGWLFTTNAYHVRHHSADFVESNSNYGCAAILWDRVFGTFADTGVREAGIGPSEPTTLEKLLIPIREPAGSVIAPQVAHG
jgi:sterol desaturase/sphingolipid hydroxylase (fatty acid hydroxylase superfamily)